MNHTRFFIMAGFIISLTLMGWIFARLDWVTFFIAIKQVKLVWMGAAGVVIVAGIMVRALRWNVIAGEPFRQYRQFWRATNLGYLGNLIYPSRAGEVLRMAAISRLALIPACQAVTSSMMDRVADGLTLGLFALLVLITHGSHGPGSRVVISIMGIFGFGAFVLVILAVRGERWHARVVGWSKHLPNSLKERVPNWYAQALESIRVLRQAQRLAAAGLLSLLAFLLDYSAIYLAMTAFGWPLPFMAAVTVGVFLAVGTSLPSAPGYVGVYQVACVMALGLYGVDESAAVAYSLVFQLLSWAIIGVQGVWVALGSGFSLSWRPSVAKLP
jgi:glycosyltransferase 2 family protein